MTWRRGSVFGTERVRALLAELGNPERGMRVVHVAGTNGKGSVVAMVDAALRAAGHRVGRFTSPPLTRYADQVRVNGGVIPEKAASRFLDEVWPWVEAQPDPPTGFELTTAMAIKWWADEGVDVAVVEAGLGGARDATNVFDAPLATAITNVTEDHLAIIGPKIEDAAREKAGIARRGVPLVTGAAGGALDVIAAAAGAAGAAPVRVAGRDFEAFPLEGDLRGQSFSVTGLRRTYPEELTVALPGAHQAANAAIALELIEQCDARGLAVRVEDALAGLRNVKWPGRLTFVEGAPSFLVDGAHNAAGVAALVEFLRDNELAPVVVFGCLEDKQWLEMVPPLAERAKAAVATAPPHPRALDPAASAREFSRAGVVATKVEDPGYALGTAVNQAGEDGLVLVCGSLYLAGVALRALGVDD